MNSSPRILLYDIETSLELVSVFDLKYNDFINPSNIFLERHLISAAWKWLGDTKVKSVSLLDAPKLYAKDPHNDKHVLEVICRVLGEADVIVGHNSDAFDIKYIETRMLYHGMSPLPPINSLDTYKIAKSRFRFNSNKLDYLGTFLGVGRKLPTSSELWLRVLKGDKRAIREMVSYNKQDVELLERVFLKLRPYMSNHISRGLFGKLGCPRCGSHHIQSRGTHKAITRTYQRFQCQACGGWFRNLKNDYNPQTVRVI